MDSHEWIRGLVGHKISVTSGDLLAKGILEEVEGGVLMIHAKHYDEPGPPEVLEQRWYIYPSGIDMIRHEKDACEKCYLESPVA